MNRVELFINGIKADLSDDLSLPMTFEQESLSNPTDVKVTFSKTIVLPGTPVNDNIFGSIFNLDRVQLVDNFNPSMRVPAVITNNSSVFESGYIQLTSITEIANYRSYNINFYGGLGDFFYGLKYNEDGTIKTLSDLTYGIRNENGVLLDPEKELDFTINKDFVYKCWTKDFSTEGNTIYDFVNFMPAYNGLYENFDNSSCLVYADGSLFPTQTTVNNVTYTTDNGYALAKLDKQYTEWEAGDLRSYKQRPVVKLSKVVDGIFNNSGYEVIKDPDFFNDNNPYWKDSYIALPLFSSTDSSEKDVESSSTTMPSETLVAKSTNNYYATMDPITNDFIKKTVDWVDISLTPDNSKINVAIDVSMFLRLDQQTTSNLYIGRNSVVAQIQVLNTSGEVVGYSPLYNFTTRHSTIGTNKPTNPWNDAPLSEVYGFFKWNGEQYVWTSSTYFEKETGYNTFRLEANNIPHQDLFEIRLYFKSFGGFVYWGYNWQDYAKYNITSFDLQTTSDSTLNVEWPSGTTSGTLITKDRLLKSETSCLDYLLSFSKLFGLYYVKDSLEKKVYVYNRNNFFQNEIINWEDRIDYSKDITINPILFDHKWYMMKYNTPDTQYAKRYSTDYNQTYGQQRLDTGYNFDSETKDLINDNVYDNVIDCIDVSKYYRNFYQKGTMNNAPGWLLDNISYTLYNNDDSTDIDIYGIDKINTANIVEWSTTRGNDVMSKVCFFDLSNDSRNLVEINNSIVFFNGVKELKAKNNSAIYFNLTDDVPEMTTLNDGEMCFLWTLSETNSNGNRIAYRLSSLPQFSRYKTATNNVVSSFDIGYPKEWYVPNVEYLPETVIYWKFWKEFYNDQFDVNTKKMTCFVRLNDLQISNEAMRKFYWFRNSYWILNKIDSYDINSNGTVRCEFIKVQDLDNYLNGVVI